MRKSNTEKGEATGKGVHQYALKVAGKSEISIEEVREGCENGDSKDKMCVH